MPGRSSSCRMPVATKSSAPSPSSCSNGMVSLDNVMRFVSGDDGSAGVTVRGF